LGSKSSFLKGTNAANPRMKESLSSSCILPSKRRESAITGPRINPKVRSVTKPMIRGRKRDLDLHTNKVSLRIKENSS
jgi:hypothetical protein